MKNTVVLRTEKKVLPVIFILFVWQCALKKQPAYKLNGIMLPLIFAAGSKHTHTDKFSLFSSDRCQISHNARNEGECIQINTVYYERIKYEFKLY